MMQQLKVKASGMAYWSLLILIDSCPMCQSVYLMVMGLNLTRSPLILIFSG